jgi:hypothetical protein
MEDHTKLCGINYIFTYIDNKMCRSVEWGMETEYKFIGSKDGEGRKKTNCVKGRELNLELKEIIRKLKIF